MWLKRTPAGQLGLLNVVGVLGAEGYNALRRTLIALFVVLSTK